MNKAKPLMIRHLISIGAIFLASVLLTVYGNPYSLHCFTYADYADFDREPSAEGVVQIENIGIDFRLPGLTLSPQSIRHIEDEFQHLSNDESDFNRGRAITDVVRSHLNAVDDTLPQPDYRDADDIFNQGENRYCQCGEHARLFVEIAQLLELQARMIWLEGHVAAEYHDRQLGQWVYIDPHLGVTTTDGEGRPLSMAETIYRLERDKIVEFAVISRAGKQALDYAQFTEERPYWYRNILLNGETRAYSGSSLVEPGRWEHLVRHGQGPQVLVLNTPFDSSAGRDVESLSARKVAVTFFLMCP